VFAEDETIPLMLITALWHVTGGLDNMTAGALCARLAALALITPVPGADVGSVTVHDVIRDYLREQLGDARLAQLHGVLLDAAAVDLPRAQAAAGSGAEVIAWWELPETARYLQEHLIDHPIAAGRPEQALELAGDLRWVGARLQRFGPAAAYTDLAQSVHPRAQLLARVLGQATHLLAPTDPPHSQIDILYSRVSHDPTWGPQVQDLTADRTLPALINKWPLPDLPDRGLRRIITGQAGTVNAVAIAPDGTWLASASDDGSVRIWDPTTGQLRATLTGHSGSISFAVSLMKYDDPFEVRRRSSEREFAAAALRKGLVTAVAVARDGSWLASGGVDGNVRTWDPATGRKRAAGGAHFSEVMAVAINPAGTRLVGACRDPSSAAAQKFRHDSPVEVVDVVLPRPQLHLMARKPLLRSGGTSAGRAWDHPRGPPRP
jgi:WD domain, G-beta repeat